MHQDSFDLVTVSSRLKKLEKQNASIKKLGVTLLVGISALMLTGLAKPGNRIVEAEAFVLRGAGGLAHGGLRIGPDGGSRLELLSGRGKAMIVVIAHPSGRQVLGLSDEKGDTRAVMALEPDGTAQVALNGAGAKPRVLLKSSDEIDGLFLDDRRGYRTALYTGSLGADVAGLAITTVSGRAISLARLTIEQGGSPRCQLTSKEGQVLFDKP